MEEKQIQKSEWAIASLILGIFSFIQLFGLEKPILAIIFGVLALKNLKKNPKLSGKELAIAGIVLGIIGIVLVIIAIYLILPKFKDFGYLKAGNF